MGTWRSCVECVEDVPEPTPEELAAYEADLVKSEEELAQIKEEPVHPTYGTLKDLLAEIERDTRKGYEIRIGLHGALAWFSKQFAKGDDNG